MNRAASMGFVAVAAVFALLGVYRLLALEFESGNAYPEFSSYRADPLGLLVLHEALDSLSGSPPQRNLVPVDTAVLPDGATLLFGAAGVSEDTVKTLEHLEQFMDAGGRVVIAFGPNAYFPKKKTEESDDEKMDDESADKNESKTDGSQDSDEDSSDSDEDDMLAALVPTQDISERWGFEYSNDDINPEGESAVRVSDSDVAGDLPRKLPWHTKSIFTDLAPEWTEIYRRDGAPVVIERPWGAGSIVLLTDNFSLTNEAMSRARVTSFVSWLLGSGRPVVFEETHLGVAESVGIMALIKRYHLVSLLLAGIAVVALHVWRNAASLIPKTPGNPADSGAAPAFTTVAGIANVAARSVSLHELPQTCWKQFDTRIGDERSLSQAERRRVQEVLNRYENAPRRKRDAADAYNQIQAIVNERSPHS